VDDNTNKQAIKQAGDQTSMQMMIKQKKSGGCGTKVLL